MPEKGVQSNVLAVEGLLSGCLSLLPEVTNDVLMILVLLLAEPTCDTGV